MQDGFYRLVEIIGQREKKVVRRGKEVLIPAIPAIIPVCKTSWFMGCKSGKYPAGHKIGERSVGWRKSEINAYIEKVGMNTPTS
jgi:hypothetical protein